MYERAALACILQMAESYFNDLNSLKSERSSDGDSIMMHRDV